MTFSAEWRGHLRLAILRALAELPGGKANDSVLATATRALGFSATRDAVRTEIAWLAEQGLVATEAMGHLLVVDLLDRGAEVAEGIASVPGVQRPSRRRA